METEKKAKTILIRLSYEQWKLLKQIGLDEDISVQRLTTEAISDYIKRKFNKSFY